MNRRSVLAGTALFVPFSGCLSAVTDKNGEKDTNDKTMDGIEPEQITEVHGTLVDETSDSLPTTDGDDDRIADNDVIQTVLDRATDPGVEKTTIELASGVYERVSVSRDEFDQDVLYEATLVLEELSEYDDSATETPVGTYIQHPNQLVVMGYSGVD